MFSLSLSLCLPLPLSLSLPLSCVRMLSLSLPRPPISAGMLLHPLLFFKDGFSCYVLNKIEL